MPVVRAKAIPAVAATLAALNLEEKAALLAGRDAWSLQEIERCGVPSILVADGPHGLRRERNTARITLSDTVPATCFPTSSALGATWNPALVEEIGAAIGREARAEGVSVVLGPVANLKRSPLSGRSFECFSEDPLLAGSLAAAWIRGVQGTGVGASLKHFAANDQETRRFSVDALVDERALREIHLASFQMAVEEARPWTVMAAYNRLNGVFCCEHRELLTGILRDEWGFDGAVISDWGGVSRRADAIEAGLDLEMPGSGGRHVPELVRAVAEGRLSAEAVDVAAGRILELVARTAAAREPGHTCDRAAHHELARRAAAEAVVLLKNEGGLLPLAADARVAVVGALAREPRFQGGGSSMINPHRLDDAWTELVALRGGTAGLEYAAGYLRHEDAADEDLDAADGALLAAAVEAARAADVVVAFVGLPEAYETEGSDRLHLRLPPSHDALVEAVAEVNPRLIVVLVNGAPVEMPWADRVPAIVEGYLGGQAGGSALARVLCGAAEPGGRLPETFPRRWADSPLHTFPVGPRLAEYRESIYVGYRYYDSAKVGVLFPFGHGLAYTTFVYGDLAVSATKVAAGEGLTVTVTVTNSGHRAGWEVVQIYVRDLESTTFHPEQELRGFAKAWLVPGESRRIEVTLGWRAFARWEVERHGWAVEAGQFEIRVGASSRDIRARAIVEVVGDGVTGPARPAPAAYLDVALARSFDREAFATLYGRPLPDDIVDPPGRYTLNTPLVDMRSPAGRLILAFVRRRSLADAGGKETPLGRMISRTIHEMTLRVLCRMALGTVDERTFLALLLLANGRHGLGLRTLLRAALARCPVRLAAPGVD
jgi:beta-glucosidase